MTRYLPAQIFSVSVLTYGYRAVRLDSRASPSGVRMDIPGLGEDRTGYEKTVCGSKRRTSACLGTRAWPSRTASDGPVRGPTILCATRPFPFIPSFSFPFRSLDPTLPFFALLFISCYPGLRLTSRFCLRAPRVSIFPSIPFISVLNGRNVLIWLFSFLCLFVFFLWSRTLIDNPSSPTRPTGKHLSTPTLLFSFERSDWLLPFFYVPCFCFVHFCFYFLRCHCMFWNTLHS